MKGMFYISLVRQFLNKPLKQSNIILVKLLSYISDSYYDAKAFKERKRVVAPVKYLTEQKRVKVPVRNKKIAELKEQIKNKAEMITHLKRVLLIFNQVADRKMVQMIPHEDLDEFDALIEDDDEPEPTADTNEESAAFDVNDDALVVEEMSPRNVLPGAKPLQTDRTFSIEYTFTTDVRILKHF